MLMGIAFKGFTAGMRFNGSRLLSTCLLRGFVAAIVNRQAVFPLQFTAQFVPLDVVPLGLHTSQRLRMDQVVSDMHMHVFSIDMDAAMSLVVRQTQGVSKALFDCLELN